jgi:tRNA U34 5-methylaminomethyl-2-thiouridine-forming methyltransferase MnmC
MIEIIPTKDGSHTLRNTELNETYHSIHGAVQESEHVFIKNGLGYVLDSGTQTVEILEVGFGTGLNAFLTCKQTRHQPCVIQYTSIELYPLPQVIWSGLNYASTAEESTLYAQLHRAEWNKPEVLSSSFTLHKIQSSLQATALPASQYDLVYFDAFAPDKQPGMWTLSVFEQICKSMKPGSVLVTYCAKGQVKRDLKSAGLLVESLPGPPGKREMIRASKL